MSQWFAKKSDALVPADEVAIKAFRRIYEGEAVLLTLVRPRSGQWHRFFFACCREIGMNMEPYRTEKQVCEMLKLAAGHVDIIESPSGDVYQFPRSIAFDKLTADEWEMLWPSLDEAMRTKFRFDCEAFKHVYK